MAVFYIFPVFTLSEVSLILVWSDAILFDSLGPPVTRPVV